MKIEKEKPGMIKYTEDYICNKCGESCYYKTRHNTEHLGVSALADGCYRKDHDRCDKGKHHDNYYTFDLCYNCINELFKSFKIPAEEAYEDKFLEE